MADFGKKPNVPASSTAPNKVVISSITDFQKFVKFSDKDVSRLVNSLISTLDYAEYRCKANIIDSLHFLLGAALEIAIQYYPTHSNVLTRVVPGDIVSCKFGTHVSGEISGMSVHSIVCDIEDDGRVYLLPITKSILDGDARKYMLIRAPHDVSYFNPPKSPVGTVLLRMGKYVRPERIPLVVGKTSPEFFRNVLRAFHDSMNFLCNVPEEELFLTSGDTPWPDDNALDSAMSTTTPTVTAAPKTKKLSFEAYMQNLFEPILDSINDPTFSIDDKVALLISELGLEDKLALVHDAFVVSCEVPRVTMPSILAALNKIHKSLDKETLKSALTVSYEQWLSQQHPEILELYPNTSIMTLFKIFSKKMK